MNKKVLIFIMSDVELALIKRRDRLLDKALV